MNLRSELHRLYNTLIKEYGPQGWWPVFLADTENELADLRDGYHPGSYDIPKTDTQRLEVSIGAILTQNTSWKNAATALASIHDHGLLSIDKLKKTSIDKIALVIKSAGYYNQKARYLKNFIEFISDYPFEKLNRLTLGDARRVLLSVKGIGPETADCVLLYALKKPSFVVDAYTIRILEKVGIISRSMTYHQIQTLFESNLDRNVIVYQEFHALFVTHGKCHYQRKPYGESDWLLRHIKK